MPITLPPPTLTDPWETVFLMEVEGLFLVKEKERLQEKSVRQ